MVEVEEFLLGFSILLSLFLYILRAAMDSISMGLGIPISPPPSFPWVTQVMVQQLGASFMPHNLHQDIIAKTPQPQIFVHVGNIVLQEDLQQEGNGISINEVYSQANAEQIRSRRRPTRLLVPEYCPALEFGAECRKTKNVEFMFEGQNYGLAGKKGRRENMEDRYKVVTDISGDPKQAFFAVIDGHGGQAAADYVAEHLGKNIVNAVGNISKSADDQHVVEQVIRGSYLLTDEEFLRQGVGSGACAASVLLKDGELHVANVGDCRVVLSRKGSAIRLTDDHRLNREDERSRIESSGGYLHYHNGVWRIQGSLCVSRAIGDLHLKEWVIAEPEIKKVQLNSDCDFLIMASDGLWDKVDEQEAVDMILAERVTMESCRKLIDISCSRGNRDDITVMVINLQQFVADG